MVKARGISFGRSVIPSWVCPSKTNPFVQSPLLHQSSDVIAYEELLDWEGAKNLSEVPELDMRFELITPALQVRYSAN